MARGKKSSQKKQEETTPSTNQHGDKQMKVTLVSGFLGSGKTSLLTHVLTNKEHQMKCAVIVNEISEFNVDALALEGAALLQSDEKMVEMSNGCICCTLREDLLEQLTSLHSKGFDAALIEASGISEPMQTAETFFFPYKAPGAKAGDAPIVLQSVAPLDNCVTVVDAGKLIEQMQSMEILDKGKSGNDNCGGGEADDRNIAALMFDQLEFANVILLNKVDVIESVAKLEGKSKVTIKSLTELIRKVNPNAEVIPTNHSKVPLSKIINTGHFTEEFATKSQGWMDDVTTGLKHVPETEEYGVSSMTFTPKVPFHPKRLMDWMRKYFVLDELLLLTPSMMKEREEKAVTLSEAEAQAKEDQWAKDVVARSQRRVERYGNLFRGKGYAWVGSPKRWHVFAMWGQAGNTLSFGSQGTWDQFPQNTSSEPVAVDPGQRLVFIGQDLKKDILAADLKECLLTEEEAAQLSKAMMKKLKNGQEDMDRADIFEDPWGPFEVREEPVEEDDSCPQAAAPAAAPKKKKKANGDTEKLSGKKRAHNHKDANGAAGAPASKKPRTK